MPKVFTLYAQWVSAFGLPIRQYMPSFGHILPFQHLKPVVGFLVTPKAHIYAQRGVLRRRLCRTKGERKKETARQRGTYKEKPFAPSGAALLNICPPFSLRPATQEETPTSLSLAVSLSRCPLGRSAPLRAALRPFGPLCSCPLGKASGT